MMLHYGAEQPTYPAPLAHPPTCLPDGRERKKKGKEKKNAFGDLIANVRVLGGGGKGECAAPGARGMGTRCLAGGGWLSMRVRVCVFVQLLAG